MHAKHQLWCVSSSSSTPPPISNFFSTLAIISLYSLPSTFSSMELPVEDLVSGRRNVVSYTIEAKELSYSFRGLYDDISFLSCWRRSQDRYILKDVNCEARSGEITAIAGPSGAGKSTLLEILGGKISPSKISGKVLINGIPVHAKSFRKLSGFVTQDDALFPLLTVEETLMYSALLRLPGGKKEAGTRVRVLLRDLGLEHVAGSRIGEGSNNGISGGERRRVSIGVELVHNPAVLLIDEPTSGLDSASALHVLSLLKAMVVKHCKTILLTIHQPGFRILELLDRLVLLSNGFVLHNGSLKLLEDRLKFSGHFIPPHINVVEFAIDVTSSLVIQTPENFTNQILLNNQQHTQESEGNYDMSSFFQLNRVEDHKPVTSPNSHFEEILILGERFFKNIFRTKQLFFTRIIQALFTGIILGTIFINNVANDQGNLALQARIGFFAFSLTFLLSSTTEGLPIFLQERRIFMRESSRGAYRVSSYVISNTLIFIPFLLMIALLYTTPVYWLVGLRRNADGFFYFSLVVWMVILMSNSFTACFSALVPNFIMGTSVISGLMGSFFLFSGYFISKENIPSYWVFMHYLSLFKYPYECFMINEYGGGNEGRKKCIQRQGGECKMYGDGFLKQQGLKESQKWSNLAVMLVFIIGYRILCFLILWFRCYRTRK